MDDALFSALLRSLHSVEVRCYPQEQVPVEEIAEKYCYHPALQACFGAESLRNTVELLPAELLAELQDALGIRLLLLRLDGKLWMFGPFVLQTFQEKQIRPILIQHRLPASFLPSLQLFYSAFPRIADQELVRTVQALLRVLRPGTEELGFRYAAGPEQRAEPAEAQYRQRFDYQSIQKRYELENRFLRLIEEGDTGHVLAAFDRMGISEMNQRRYMNAIYTIPEVSMSMVRALSRKAAERGGAPLMEIDQITQRAVQRSVGIQGEGKNLRVLHTMILELTEAVRRHRLEEGHFSPPIRKAVTFLRFNYSQSVHLEEVAQAAGLAPSYLSRQFRQEVGMTVSAHIRKLRCEQAARLLAQTQTPISEISAYVGYPDNNYFVKAFRAQYGMTPSAYRSQQREAP